MSDELETYPRRGHHAIAHDGETYIKLADAAVTFRHLRAEITHLRAELATARRDGMEEAAKIAEGEIYNERYRTWPWWEDRPGYGRGNVSEDSQLVLHCDAIAAAIRAAAGEMK